MGYKNSRSLAYDFFRILYRPQEGWELVSVQPLMRGVTEIGNQNAQGWAWGIALPVSYLLFFKRATS
ncbi:hypothetical protein IPC80_33185 [Pseudomonas aeruginosa]|nr:hypothetical protein AXW99_25530 [Pseudomonas aeruginosa]RMK89807.1 hypothetical protein IPC82_32620 [Pseudomonas aeruginosa]RMK94194.1 hypothetical protein IPC81_32305 [Pseudomonas aeruginosa]RML00867.1 hypothetical protein IPC80_33185 [Pseudomonas aeruginosa]